MRAIVLHDSNDLGGAMMRAWIQLGAVLVASMPTLAQPVPRIGPPVRVDMAPTVGAAANETTAAASEDDPTTIVAGWNDGRFYIPGTPSGRVGFNLSFDGGETWDDPDHVLLPVDPPEFHSEGDPFTAADPKTGTLWAGFVQFFPPASQSKLWVARLDANATEFDTPVLVFEGGVDKPWMAAGPLPDDPNATRLYVAFRQGSNNVVTYSNNLGSSWSTPVVIPFVRTAPLPRIGPNGYLYVAFWDFGNDVLFTRSVDGGDVFDPESVLVTRTQSWVGASDCPFAPGLFQIPPFNYLAVDPNDGTLYMVYIDIIDGQGNIDLFLIKSTDEGVNWTTPVLINSDAAPPGDQFFPWIEVDRESRLHVVFFDTRDPVQNDTESFALIHTYYMYSEEGGDPGSWNECQLTENPWDSSKDGIPNDEFIGDYLGMAVAGHRVYPMYLDVVDDQAPDVFTRVVDFCPWDCNVQFNDVVDVLDALDVLTQWDTTNPPCDGGGSCDIDVSGCVDVADLLAVLGMWGYVCPASPASAPLTLEEELAQAGLTEDDWDEHVDVMTDEASSQEDRDRYDCWMRHYMSCTGFQCQHAGQQTGCPQPDPFK